MSLLFKTCSHLQLQEAKKGHDHHQSPEILKLNEHQNSNLNISPPLNVTREPLTSPTTPSYEVTRQQVTTLESQSNIPTKNRFALLAPDDDDDDDDKVNDGDDNENDKVEDDDDGDDNGIDNVDDDDDEVNIEKECDSVKEHDDVLEKRFCLMCKLIKPLKSCQIVCTECREQYSQNRMQHR